jgi:hypothetical protein
MRHDDVERTPEGVAAAWVLGFGVVATGLILDPRVEDAFRLPKELVFRGVAIVLLAIAVFAATRRDGRWRDLLRGVTRVEWLLCAAIGVWTVVTALLSTNRLLSAESAITVLAALVIVLSARRPAPSLPLIAMDICLVPALLNAVLVILQELKIWTPFVHEAEASTQYKSVGLLGNTDYVGSYLAGPALAAIVLAVVASGARRWIYAAIAALVGAGVVLSETRTALIALVVALAFFSLRSRRSAFVAVAVVVVVAALMISPRTPLGVRMRELVDAASKHDNETLISERLVPALAAVDMIRDHPLTGVGPGCFRFNFLRYRLRLGEHYPPAWTRGVPGYWSAVHNDHLEVAAETGLPGYALFLVAIFMGVRMIGASRGADGLEVAFARAMRLPLAALILVLCVAQFPLELAAPRLALLTLGALCIGWGGRHAAH